jgi:transposase-like protein
MAEDDGVFVEAVSKNTETLERLLETTQDLFILQCLQLGMPVHPVKRLVGVSTDRVTRISKVQRKAARARAKAEKAASKGAEK